MSMQPTLTQDAQWIYVFPTQFKTPGMIATAIGVVAAYYMYGSPLDAIAAGDYTTVAFGYVVGGVAATAALMILNKAQTDQYQ